MFVLHFCYGFIESESRADELLLVILTIPASKRLNFCMTNATLTTGAGFAYTLSITTCTISYASTANLIVFAFCEGGTYCTPTYEKEVTSNDGLNTDGATINVAVSGGIEPTTVVVSNAADDAWCVSEISWEGEDNLIGASGAVWFDRQFNVASGCNEGLSNPGSPYPCQQSWRFFDLDRADGYTYDVKVTACEGTQSSTILASFCSTSWCTTDFGELVNTTLTMNEGYGSETKHQVELPFNPLAMKLTEVDSDWCADKMTFNGFAIIGSSNSVTKFKDTDEDGTRTFTLPKIQYNGFAPTPSPTTSPTPAPTRSPKLVPPRASIIAAGVVGFVLLTVLVATCVGVKRHCAAENKHIRQCCEALWAKGSFWSSMVVWAGLFVTLNVFKVTSMWGIVSICAAFVLLFVVLAWFIIFKIETPATGSVVFPSPTAVDLCVSSVSDGMRGQWSK